MPAYSTDVAVLNREFLEIRCRLLDIASALDRIDRTGGAGARTDSRYLALMEATEILVDGRDDRARRVQMVFSERYDESWRGRLDR